MDEFIKACVKGMVLGKFELDFNVSYCFLPKAGKYKNRLYFQTECQRQVKTK